MCGFIFFWDAWWEDANVAHIKIFHFNLIAEHFLSSAAIMCLAFITFPAVAPVSQWVQGSSRNSVPACPLAVLLDPWSWWRAVSTKKGMWEKGFLKYLFVILKKISDSFRRSESGSEEFVSTEWKFFQLHWGLLAGGSRSEMPEFCTQLGSSGI